MKMDTLVELVTTIGSENGLDEWELKLEPKCGKKFRLIGTRNENVLAIFYDRPQHVRTELDKFKQGKIDYTEMINSIAEE